MAITSEVWLATTAPPASSASTAVKMTIQPVIPAANGCVSSGAGLGG
jgi:hypothetical protein